jgi:hypothetical protein
MNFEYGYIKKFAITNLTLPTGSLHFFARPKKRSKKRAACAKCHEKFQLSGFEKQSNHSKKFF